MSASPYNANAALCCRLASSESNKSSKGRRPSAWQMPTWLSLFCASRPRANAAISLS